MDEAFLKRIDEASDELHDLSPMPFGKHQGTPMQDVPTDYLHWLWLNGLEGNKRNPVHRYIKKSLHCLQTENPDLIW
jgi:hypothetical protein